MIYSQEKTEQPRKKMTNKEVMRKWRRQRVNIQRAIDKQYDLIQQHIRNNQDTFPAKEANIIHNGTLIPIQTKLICDKKLIYCAIIYEQYVFFQKATVWSERHKRTVVRVIHPADLKQFFADEVFIKRLLKI